MKIPMSVKPLGMVATAAMGLLAVALMLTAAEVLLLLAMNEVSKAGPVVELPTYSMLASAKPVLLGDSMIRNCAAADTFSASLMATLTVPAEPTLDLSMLNKSPPVLP